MDDPHEKATTRWKPVALLAVLPAATGCSAALVGNLVIVLLALAIFVGTIRLGGSDTDKDQDPSGR
jgi:hypothetical protein